MAIGVLLRGLVMAMPMSGPAQASDKRVVEVCSASGLVQNMSLDSRASGKPDGPELPHAKHCPWCALSHDNLMPLGSMPLADRVALSSLRLTAWRDTPTRPALAWVSLPSRAPPLI